MSIFCNKDRFKIWYDDVNSDAVDDANNLYNRITPRSILSNWSLILRKVETIDKKTIIPTFEKVEYEAGGSPMKSKFRTTKTE